MTKGSKKAIKRSQTNWTKKVRAAAVRAARNAGARRRTVRRAGV